MFSNIYLPHYLIKCSVNTILNLKKYSFENEFFRYN